MTGLNVVKCGKLIDGVSDRTYDNVVLVVNDQRIEEVGSEEDVDIPNSANWIDHSDKVVLPGLIDAHVHLGGWRSLEWFDWLVEDPSIGAARATNDLSDLIQAGFTTVREMGSRTGLGLKQAVSEGEIEGPRVFSSGLGISQTGGFSDPDYLPHEWAMEEGNGISTLADGPHECRKAARKRLRDGADLIKIWTTGSASSESSPSHQAEFSDEEVEVFTEEAHRSGIPVASHAVGSDGVVKAVRNGVDTIEHGLGMDDDCIELMAESDTIMVPTLSYSHQFASEGGRYGVSERQIEVNEQVHEDGVKTVRKAYEAGVPIALGTDFCGQEIIPHGENILEAEIYVDEVGMDEMDAIKAATSVAGRTLPADDVGTLQEGMRADFITVENDPLTNISALKSVNTVYKGGQKVEV